ncbi:phosphatidylinositol 3,4,5-trisphosphate 3-phosphatase and dual-specificity protein phosphatase PTEN-like [Paramacrobiotus metropolitanus]|uniref:phosphatidylinositol 3,4,5-trisphosphate 3-phosphatase and dual-specificity protein phosphatase PTEN-like n=1 Tax=Paramacrobiotus metropolitanus TaxID=2943436 RepID=UPI0024462669|nr:phosphatidylinositol 3,4,5-trisphosphate 3-phosphatase and dual-specificity protein phosphatase PTEN-like [Paramacrobiotus metropolitanus]
MTQVLRRIVSQNRRRLVCDGFDLDLTYILPNLIAMGFPAENYERIYRNNINDVVRFFEMKHPGHYRIYNLCSERSYDPSRFRHNVVVYPFEDHQIPCIDLIKSCCEDIHNWLLLDPDNIAAVHCKAGKGRTGLIICCYLLHSQFVRTPEEALAFYGETRTVDSHGVTIPSQRRYIRYYYRLLQSGLNYRDLALQLDRSDILNTPSTDDHPCSGLIFSVIQLKREIWSSEVLPLRPSSRYSRADNCTVELRPSLTIAGDILVECHGVYAPFMLAFGPLFPRREKIFQFWFNTFFVGDEAEETRTSDNPDQVALSISRDHMDMLTKDKHFRNFPPNFKVLLWFTQPNGSHEPFPHIHE